MPRITIDLSSAIRPATEDEVRKLESGAILFFPESPVEVTEDERIFLLSQKQSSARFHKNISYRPNSDRLKGTEPSDRETFERTHEIMRHYSKRSVEFLQTFIPVYARNWRIDYASFRPIEEKGRDIKHRARNDLIHVDSFPTRPSYGNRLLRIFININPTQDRHWITSYTFAELAKRYADKVGLPSRPNSLTKVMFRIAEGMSRIGLPVTARPPYDRFMLNMHHYLKESEEFQENCPKEHHAFPPGSGWMVFTDAATHACTSGQYALEQTFMIHRNDLCCPEVAPISILERMAGFEFIPTATT